VLVEALKQHRAGDRLTGFLQKSLGAVPMEEWTVQRLTGDEVAPVGARSGQTA